jgi:hypothetical protein
MATPAGRPSRPRWILPLVIAVVVLAIAAVGVGVALVLREPGSDTSNAAIEACQDAVRKQLRSPSSAKFSEDRVVERAGATHYVHGVVDAQNGFGAMLRNRYECIANQQGASWSVANASLHDWP